MSADRELLELAAKAAGIEVVGYADRLLVLPEHERSLIRRHESGGDVEWNPIADDGDALRLAVKLGLKISVGYDIGLVFCRPSESNEHEVWEPLGKNDPYAATRRAITRAAAAIGEGMS